MSLKDKKHQPERFGVEYYTIEDVEEAVKELKKKIEVGKICCVHILGGDHQPCKYTTKTVLKIIEEVFG